MQSSNRRQGQRAWTAGPEHESRGGPFEMRPEPRCPVFEVKVITRREDGRAGGRMVSAQMTQLRERGRGGRGDEL
jgi:hypothetical protein